MGRSFSMVIFFPSLFVLFFMAIGMTFVFCKEFLLTMDCYYVRPLLMVILYFHAVFRILIYPLFISSHEFKCC